MSQLATIPRDVPGEIIEHMPAMSVGQARERYAALVGYVKEQMVEGKDYGKIPGSDKPTLLKPGSEKLCSFFGLRVEDPELIERTEDWTGKDHGGEPFFYYLVRQRLTRHGEVVASQLASCNSWESKYRYRKGQRVCPTCGKPSILRSKYPPREDPRAEPGWYCFAKSGGCGANFAARDAGIVSQQVGRVPNPDVCDQVNTILKMAEKRALIAACLVAVNASEFFTQDLEDLAHEAAQHDNGHHEPARAPEQPEAKPARNDENGFPTWEARIQELRDACKANLVDERLLAKAVGNAERLEDIPEKLYVDARRIASAPHDAVKLKPKKELPTTGKELLERLRKLDAELAEEGVIIKGDLVAHMLKAGTESGYGEDIEAWKGANTMRAAATVAARFALERRKIAKEKATVA